MTTFPAPAPGNVYVIDLYGVDANSNIDPAFVEKLDLSAYPSSFLGKGPLYISSGEGRGQFLVSNAKDYNNGVAGISFRIDAQTGQLGGGATVRDVSLRDAQLGKYRLNIQRAAGSVILQYQGETYALVADYNLEFNDAYARNANRFTQIGGKIGVIQDPFGEHGEPVYLGATTPIPGASLDQLTLDQNGMLYATALVEDTSGHYTGGVYSDLIYRSMFVWNASQLVEAALNAQKAGRPATVPIDRDGVGAASQQFPAVTPARYDTNKNGELFGTIYGIGTYSSRQSLPTLTLQDVPFLKQLAPSVYETARTAAISAGIPTNTVDRGDGSVSDTIERFAVRTMAQLLSLGSITWGSFQAAVGNDNSEMMAQWEEAQLILKNIGYNTEDGGLLASAAQTTDGLLGGMVMLDTNFLGIFAQDTALIRGLATGVRPTVPTPTEFLQMLNDDPSLGEVVNYMALATLKYNPITLGAENLYRMSSAWLEGNWVELRNASVDMLGLALLTKWAETPAGKRDMQLKTKQVAFLQQKMRRGVIEETPLKDLAAKTANTKRYVIESAQRDANGLPVTEGRVLTEESFADAARAVAEITESGEVRYQGCFAAGTLVCTNQGLLPIEKIQVGTRVLSQPEDGGVRDYRPVINTVAHLAKEVWAVQIKVEGADMLTTLIATPNHPFWVEGPLVAGKHWMAAECLEPGFIVQLSDGRNAIVYAAGLVRRTQHPNIAFASDDRAGTGVLLDVSGKQIKQAENHLALTLEKLTLSEPLLIPVYNFEVEEFHTYYVGDAGVWVHNTNCPVKSAVQGIFEKVEIEKWCFTGGTPVHIKGGICEIEFLEVGTEVLSRCEFTGELAYKKITTVFQRHPADVLWISFSCEAEYESINGKPFSIIATAEHPFWIKNRGWTKVGDLQPGDEFLTYDGKLAVVDRITNKGSQAVVYNIEVEEFHTYFVGEEGVWVHNKNTKIVSRILNPIKAPNATPQPTPFVPNRAL